MLRVLVESAVKAAGRSQPKKKTMFYMQDFKNNNGLSFFLIIYVNTLYADNNSKQTKKSDNICTILGLRYRFCGKDQKKVPRSVAFLVKTVETDRFREKYMC